MVEGRLDVAGLRSLIFTREETHLIGQGGTGTALIDSTSRVVSDFCTAALGSRPSVVASNRPSDFSEVRRGSTPNLGWLVTVRGRGWNDKFELNSAG